MRFYSRGNTETVTSRYTEIEVYGRAPAIVQLKDEAQVPLRIQLPKPIFS